MLQNVFIAGAASYPPDGRGLTDCKAVNYIFGTNGSGKTTISRVITDPKAYPPSSLTWANAREIERLVYNADFVERNFSSIRGIFTLGEKSGDALEQIRGATEKRTKLEDEISNLDANLKGTDGNGGKQRELRMLRDGLEDACWTIKQKYGQKFVDAFKGYLDAKRKFCDKLLLERSANKGTLITLDVLERRAATVYQKGIERKLPLSVPSFTSLIGLENSTILAKKIVGKSDVNIAALIQRLGNSDWVKKGRDYFGESQPRCPFCQQDAPHDLTKELEEYFDEAYLADIAAIDHLQQAYQTYSQAVLAKVDQIAQSKSEFLDGVLFEAECDRLRERVALNIRQLEAKRKEPSSVVTIEGLEPVTSAITSQLIATNNAVALHNTTVDNLTAEKTKLSADIWRFAIEELKVFLETYDTNKLTLDKAIEGLMNRLRDKNTGVGELKGEISALERSVTSAQPTVDEINGILASFGFTNFKLATAGSRNEQYKIERPDGSDAAKTLSDGERGFLTFLYFYHLIKGSLSESGTTTDRVIVFDDPVSSLDSDVLFIVSTLIKGVIDQAKTGKGQIKQVFVLTHNIYFHKEVSFNKDRDPKKCRKDETFWIVRKQDGVSKITSYEYNPIKTSYELLWADVRDPGRSKVTIQNTLRRIIENYFIILGNQNKDAIIAKFTGRDKQVCATLFSWMNDGSHGIQDDLSIVVDDAQIEMYLDVFKRVFRENGHEGHYLMMMGSEPEKLYGGIT